ncbi:MAG: DNA cytosine methyltransferase, partial [bacterium]
MNELALFAGAGGGILAGKLLGWRTVCAVEIDDYRRRVLLQRQDDGLLDPFPIWSDIRTFDGRPWARCVDIVTGGFPCQDISVAGRGAGIDGERSGLWSEMARVIREVRPGYVLVENSPALIIRGLGRVLGDLAEMGMDARWGVLGADDVGAPHIRKRIWIVGHAHGPGRERERQAQSAGRVDPLELVGAGSDVADANSVGWQAWIDGLDRRPQAWETVSGWWAEPDVDRMAHGVPARMDRLAALGDAQVPAVAALAWRVLTSQ